MEEYRRGCCQRYKVFLWQVLFPFFSLHHANLITKQFSVPIRPCSMPNHPSQNTFDPSSPLPHQLSSYRTVSELKFLSTNPSPTTPSSLPSSGRVVGLFPTMMALNSSTVKVLLSALTTEKEGIRRRKTRSLRLWWAFWRPAVVIVLSPRISKARDGSRSFGTAAGTLSPHRLCLRLALSSNPPTLRFLFATPS